MSRIPTQQFAWLRVVLDEHSLEFRLLSKLSNAERSSRDFQIWNERAGGMHVPKVPAIVRTMVGSTSQVKATWIKRLA